MSNNEIVTDAITEARNKCTIREQRFCEEYVRGTPAYRAYIDAGYAPKNDNYARTASSRVMTKAHVKAYITALKDQDTVSAIMGRHERMKMLSKIVRGNESKAPNVSIGALRELNRMTGEYRPESLAVQGHLTLFEAITGKRRKE